MSTLLTLLRLLGNTGAVANARNAAATRTHEEAIIAALTARLDDPPATVDAESASAA